MTFLVRKNDPAVLENTKMVIFHLGEVRDLVHAIPVDTLNELGRYEITWVILNGNRHIMQNCVPERKFVEADPAFSFASAVSVYKWLVKENFGLCLHLDSPLWVKWAALAARIPFRAGHIGSPLDAPALNSSCIAVDEGLHMTDIYHKMTSECFQIIHDDRGLPTLSLQPKDTGVFVSISLAPQQYYHVHLSASKGQGRWPAQNYLELIKGLIGDFPVVVTASSSDFPRFRAMQEKISHNPQVIWLGHGLTSEQLIDVISQSRVFIGPDSDEIQVAAACGIPVVGIFSQHAVDRPEARIPRGRLTVTVQPPPNFAGKHSLKHLSARQVLEKVHKFS